LPRLSEKEATPSQRDNAPSFRGIGTPELKSKPA